MKPRRRKTDTRHAAPVAALTPDSFSPEDFEVNFSAQDLKVDTDALDKIIRQGEKGMAEMARELRAEEASEALARLAAALCLRKVPR